MSAILKQKWGQVTLLERQPTVWNVAQLLTNHIPAFSLHVWHNIMFFDIKWIYDILQVMHKIFDYNIGVIIVILHSWWDRDFPVQCWMSTSVLHPRSCAVSMQTLYYCRKSVYNSHHCHIQCKSHSLSHSHVYKQNVNVKCPSKWMPSEAVWFGCYCLWWYL